MLCTLTSDVNPGDTVVPRVRGDKVDVAYLYEEVQFEEGRMNRGTPMDTSAFVLAVIFIDDEYIKHKKACLLWVTTNTRPRLCWSWAHWLMRVP